MLPTIRQSHPHYRHPLCRTRTCMCACMRVCSRASPSSLSRPIPVSVRLGLSRPTPAVSKSPPIPSPPPPTSLSLRVAGFEQVCVWLWLLVAHDQRRECKHVRMHTLLSISMREGERQCVCTCVHARIRACVHMCGYMCACMRVCMCSTGSRVWLPVGSDCNWPRLCSSELQLAQSS